MSLVPDTPRVRSGETLAVSVVFTNTGSDPLPIDAVDGCSDFEVGLYDARGVRVDFVLGDCGTGGGCGGPNLRLVVEPGGTLTRHKKFSARIRRRTPASGCYEVDAGPLPPGRYTLRASPSMANWLSGPDVGRSSASVSIEVTR
jgi:hypothetical protein